LCALLLQILEIFSPTLAQTFSTNLTYLEREFNRTANLSPESLAYIFENYEINVTKAVRDTSSRESLDSLLRFVTSNLGTREYLQTIHRALHDVAGLADVL